MQKFSSFILKYRVLVISIILLITVALGIQLKDLKINSDITTYLPADDKSVVLFKYIGKEYSTSSTAIIIVESKDIFSKETIAHIQALTDKLKNTEGVEFVTSLTNILDIKKTPDGFEIARLIDEYNLPQSDEELNKIKSYALSKDMYKGQIISEDGQYTIIMCQLNEAQNKTEMAKRIREAAMSFNFPEKLYFEGIPFQFQSILTSVMDDLILLTPMIVVLILITLFFSFRSIRAVLMPVISVAIGIIWTISLMVIAGIELSPISDALPVVLFAVGSAYGIHVVNRFKLRVNDNSKKNEQIKGALSEVTVAVLLAGITTFVGFLSFVFSSYLEIVREFGIFASMGVVFTLIISLTLIPALESFFPAYKVKEPEKKKVDILGRFLNWLSEAVLKYKKGIFIGALVIVAVSLTGIPQIKRKVDILEYFKPETNIRQSAKIMNKEFGGSLPIQIVVKGDILTPEVLNKIKDLQNYMKTIKGISNVRSVADYIEQINDAMDEGKMIPDSREKIANLWFLIESESMMSQMINFEKNEAVIYATMANLDAKSIHNINDGVSAYATKLNDTQTTFEVTGMQAIYSNLDDSMMNNLIQSTVMAFIFIFITMRFLIGTFKGALTGMITLFFSIAFIFGFMGYVGIALDIATILIASITVGTGIDYSIHFVTSYKDYLKQNHTIEESIRHTFTATGRAIVINILTIILGFLVLLFANLIPLQQFGILIAVTMFCSGFGALTIMPAIISLFKINISRKIK